MSGLVFFDLSCLLRTREMQYKYSEERPIQSLGVSHYKKQPMKVIA
jgi:hypothetical protein